MGAAGILGPDLVPSTDDSLALVWHVAPGLRRRRRGHLLQKVVIVVIVRKSLLVFVLEERPFFSAVPSPSSACVAAAAEAGCLRGPRRPEGQVRQGRLRLQPGEQAGAAVREGDRVQPGKEERSSVQWRGSEEGEFYQDI